MSYLFFLAVPFEFVVLLEILFQLFLNLGALEFKVWIFLDDKEVINRFIFALTNSVDKFLFPIHYFYWFNMHYIKEFQSSHPFKLSLLDRFTKRLYFTLETVSIRLFSTVLYNLQL